MMVTNRGPSLSTIAVYTVDWPGRPRSRNPSGKNHNIDDAFSEMFGLYNRRMEEPDEYLWSKEQFVPLDCSDDLQERKLVAGV